MAFPPVPQYPQAIDSDRTLYLVYNTTETKLCQDNAAWADELDIVPAPVGKEVWADNGFGNIEGELFYYDSVEKNAQGMVVKLKGCARQMAGKTKFNPKGTWVRGFVVAEHHNQIVDTLLKVEDFIGYNFDPRPETLDWRIRNLQALDVIFDDYNCPDIDFTFNIVENNPVTGILASYVISVTPPGSISSFRLDFGDGQFTSSSLSGQHRYAINATIDPVVTVVNNQCQIVQTPIERSNPAEPNNPNSSVFDIAIPESPTVPDFTFVPCNVPEPQINLAPIVFPCISLEGQLVSIPSIITGPDIHMVSQVQIIGPDNPVNITQSVVTIEGNVNIPSIIFVDVPPTIVIDPPIPPTIVVVAQNSAIALDVGDLPKLEVDWGAPPPMEVALTMGRPVRTPQPFASDPSIRNEFGQEFADLFDAADHVHVQYEPVGIPSEIVIVPPTFPSIKVDAEGLPSSIKLETADVKIPENIHVLMDGSLPERIILDGSNVPETIEVNWGRTPEVKVHLEVPEKIDLELTTPIPDKISVEMLRPIPERIILDASGIPETISVVGFPEAISVVGIPETIELLPPKELPPVEMVYKGSAIPVEVKVTMAEMMPSEEKGKNCFMMVPCGR